MYVYRRSWIMLNLGINNSRDSYMAQVLHVNTENSLCVETNVKGLVPGTSPGIHPSS